MPEAPDAPADHGLVVVDVETTGLGHVASPPRKDGVVQVGLAWRSVGEILSAQWTCNPGSDSLVANGADEALRIHHLSMARVQAAPSSVEVATLLKHTVLPRLRHPTHGLTLLAYNVMFDRGFLERHPWSLGTLAWGECLMVEAARRMGGGERWLRLVDACERAKIALPPEQAHTAAGDARAAYLLMEQMRYLGDPQ